MKNELRVGTSNDEIAINWWSAAIKLDPENLKTGFEAWRTTDEYYHLVALANSGGLDIFLLFSGRACEAVVDETGALVLPLPDWLSATAVLEHKLYHGLYVSAALPLEFHQGLLQILSPNYREMQHLPGSAYTWEKMGEVPTPPTRIGGPTCTAMFTPSKPYWWWYSSAPLFSF